MAVKSGGTHTRIPEEFEKGIEGDIASVWLHQLIWCNSNPREGIDAIPECVHPLRCCMIFSFLYFSKWIVKIVSSMLFFLPNRKRHFTISRYAVKHISINLAFQLKTQSQMLIFCVLYSDGICTIFYPPAWWMIEPGKASNVSINWIQT